MHAASYQYVAAASKVIGPRRRVLEIGSCNVNGSVRPLFPGADYIGIDTRPGPEVDVVADGGVWRPEPDKTFDLVVSTECLEHTPAAEAICRTAFDVLEPGGAFIVTAAGPDRAPHGVDGENVGEEFYENIEPELLAYWLTSFAAAMIDCTGQDVRALAIKAKNADLQRPRIPLRCTHLGKVLRRERCSCEGKYIRACSVHGEIVLQRCYTCPDFTEAKRAGCN